MEYEQILDWLMEHHNVTATGWQAIATAVSSVVGMAFTAYRSWQKLDTFVRSWLEKRQRKATVRRMRADKETATRIMAWMEPMIVSKITVVSNRGADPAQLTEAKKEAMPAVPSSDKRKCCPAFDCGRWNEPDSILCTRCGRNLNEWTKLTNKAQQVAEPTTKPSVEDSPSTQQEPKSAKPTTGETIYRCEGCQAKGPRKNMDNHLVPGSGNECEYGVQFLVLESVKAVEGPVQQDATLLKCKQCHAVGTAEFLGNHCPLGHPGNVKCGCKQFVPIEEPLMLKCARCGLVGVEKSLQSHEYNGVAGTTCTCKIYLFA